MKKSVISAVLAGYRKQLEAQRASRKKERRLERLFILEDIVDVKQHNSTFINVELMDSGVVTPHKNPLAVSDIIALNKNICEWLDGPEYDLVSY